MSYFILLGYRAGIVPMIYDEDLADMINNFYPNFDD